MRGCNCGYGYNYDHASCENFFPGSLYLSLYFVALKNFAYDLDDYGYAQHHLFYHSPLLVQDFDGCQHLVQYRSVYYSFLFQNCDFYAVYRFVADHPASGCCSQHDGYCAVVRGLPIGWTSTYHHYSPSSSSFPSWTSHSPLQSHLVFAFPLKQRLVPHLGCQLHQCRKTTGQP